MLMRKQDGIYSDFPLNIWGKHFKAIWFLGYFLSIGAGETQEGILAGKMINFKLTVWQ